MQPSLALAPRLLARLERLVVGAQHSRQTNHERNDVCEGSNPVNDFDHHLHLLQGQILRSLTGHN